MEYVLSRFRIKRGKVNVTKEFLNNLESACQLEMTEVLKEAAVTLDCSFVHSDVNGDFVYIFKRLADSERLKQCISKSGHPLYERIRNWAKDCFESGEDWHAVAVFDPSPGGT